MPLTYRGEGGGVSELGAMPLKSFFFFWKSSLILLNVALLGDDDDEGGGCSGEDVCE